MTRGGLALLILFGVATAEARQVEPAPALFRIFLTTGQTLTSYGEWATLADRVVFSIPVTVDATRLHLLSVPSTAVDWPRTERYAKAVRASRYAATRGEADFAALTTEVAAALNQVAFLSDPMQRLARAEQARAVLADWPGTHHGYRAREVGEIVGLLDEVIAELRAAAGLGRFELSFVTAPVAPEERLLPAPGTKDIVDELVLAASLAESAEARVSVLQTVLHMLDRAFDLLPASWAAGVRRTAVAAITEERRIDAQYAALRTDVLQRATRASARGDVRGVERLLTTVRQRDTALGSRRPEQTTALVSVLTVHLDAARRLRLAQDRWQLQLETFRAYQRAVQRPLDALAAAEAELTSIRALAGPEPDRLQRLDLRLMREGLTLQAVTPPADLEAVHAVLQSAWNLAENAVRLRLDAVRDGDLSRAHEASAAAAGALLLAERARADLQAALTRPALP